MEFKERQLSVEEVYANIDDYGLLKLGNVTEGIPKNSKFIAKILAPVDVKWVEPLENNVYIIPVEIKDGLEEPLHFNVRISESAAKRMMAKNPNDSYVDKRAFFVKSTYKGNVVHHINVITKESNSQGKPELKLKAKTEETTEEKKMPDFGKKEDTPLVDHNLPDEKKPKLPAELTEWSEQFKKLPKEDFINSFAQDGNYPKTFVGWVSDSEACGTDYFTKFEGEQLRAEATKVYYALCHELGY